MSRIEYKTEGKVQIDCAGGNAQPIVLTWLEGGLSAMLHGGGCHVIVSKSQLNQLGEIAHRIADDLGPNRVVRAVEKKPQK